MRKLFVTVGLLLIGFTGFARAQFCPGISPWVFDDVLSTHPFCTDITWMAERGVTFGCKTIDANHRLYCPTDSVPREQMAAFMHRLGDELFPLSCAPGQVMKWNGLAWACSDDNIGGGHGGGTVTSVAAGTGLTATPNPIVGAGTVSVAASYRLPQGCPVGQVPKWSGASWACAPDVSSGGTVTGLTAGAGIALAPNPIVGAGTVAADTSYVQRRVSASCAPGSSIRAIAADGSVTCETDDSGPANAFVQGGNAFGATAVLGTIDNRTLELHVNNVAGLRVQTTAADPANGFNTATPNVIGGWNVNDAYVGVIGATIGGGGGAWGWRPTSLPITTGPSGAARGTGRATEPAARVTGGSQRWGPLSPAVIARRSSAAEAIRRAVISSSSPEGFRAWLRAMEQRSAAAAC